MMLHEIPPLKKGMWTTTFYFEGHQVIEILNFHDRIQNEDQASLLAAQELKQFNPKLQWDEYTTKFTDENSM